MFVSFLHTKEGLLDIQIRTGFHMLLEVMVTALYIE